MVIVRDVRFGTDYIDENDVLHVGGSGGLMVISAEQIALLPANYYGPGTLAHTAGYAAVWEKGIDGTWTNIKGGEDIGD